MIIPDSYLQYYPRSIPINSVIRPLEYHLRTFGDYDYFYDYRKRIVERKNIRHYYNIKKRDKKRSE